MVSSCCDIPLESFRADGAAAEEVLAGNDEGYEDRNEVCELLLLCGELREAALRVKLDERWRAVECRVESLLALLYRRPSAAVVAAEAALAVATMVDIVKGSAKRVSQEGQPRMSGGSANKWNVVRAA